MLVQELTVYCDFRRDHVRIFELRLKPEPRIRIDSREIVGAEFADRQTLLRRGDLPPFIRAYLDRT